MWDGDYGLFRNHSDWLVDCKNVHHGPQSRQIEGVRLLFHPAFSFPAHFCASFSKHQKVHLQEPRSGKNIQKLLGRLSQKASWAFIYCQSLIIGPHPGPAWHICYDCNDFQKIKFTYSCICLIDQLQSFDENFRWGIHALQVHRPKKRC